MKMLSLIISGFLAVVALIFIMSEVDITNQNPCYNAQAVDFEGYQYDLVEIGSQCWFAENLRTQRYANGDWLWRNLSDNLWIEEDEGAQTVYGEGDSKVKDGCRDEATNLRVYGRLYNYYAVDDPRGLCPSGWHVPTDREWMTLEMELGMTSLEANSLRARGTNEGDQMKSLADEVGLGWNGTNTSGFSALPGGSRDNLDGGFMDEGVLGLWWTASSDGPYLAFCRILISDTTNVFRSRFRQGDGLSVRCLRDE